MALLSAGCGTSIYLAAGDGAYDRKDPRGALQAYVAARKFERKRMSRSERGLLRSRTARAVRALIDPRVDAACKLAPKGARALAELMPLYLVDAGMLAELSVQERAAVDRRIEACMRDAIRVAIGYAGVPLEKTSELIGLAGRVQMLRRQLGLPAAPAGKQRPADRKARIAVVLRDVAREALAGMFDVCDALVDADRPFVALDVGRATVLATARDKVRLRRLAGRVRAWLLARAKASAGHKALAATLRDLAANVAGGPGPAKTPRTRPLVHWQVGHITSADCDAAVGHNLQWALATNVPSRYHATVDVHLERCRGDEGWHVERVSDSSKKTTSRRYKYPHEWLGYLQTWECELTNVVSGRKCEVRRSGDKAAVQCRSTTTLKKLCRPSAGPIESRGVVEQVVRRTRRRRFTRRVHKGRWRYAISGVATVRWGDRTLAVPLQVKLERKARWWSDKRGSKAKPDINLKTMRKAAVAEVVAKVHALAVSVTSQQIHEQTGAAAMSLQHGDIRDWAEHMLRAIHLGHHPDGETLHRLAPLLGAPVGRYHVEQRGPGLPPRHVIKPGFVMAELRGGELEGKFSGDTFTMPKARKDRFVENLRSIVQRPILMPARKDSHYEVIGTVGPSPLDARRISPRLRARARLFGWLSVGFGGDLEALGQGTRGWMAELAAGPTLSNSFARIELFGRLARERLLARADDLDSPHTYSRREDIYVGLRATTGGTLGAWLELAGSTAVLTGGADFGGEGFEAHPLSAGVILDLRVAWLRAGATYWYGEHEPVAWFGALGLRL